MEDTKVVIQGSEQSLVKVLEGLKKRLSEDLSEKAEALPAGFSRDRFVLNCVEVLKAQLKDEKSAQNFAKVTYSSIIDCFEKAAFLGLDFFNGECYAIPYGKSLQFQTDYKGEIKLCKAYSTNAILNIFAKVVREGDVYSEEVIDGDQKIVFKPLPFNDKKIIGAFAIVKFRDGSMAYDSMSRQEIEDIRNNYSRAGNSKAWSKSYGEMCKKTVLRRLSKMIDKNFTADQLRAYEDGGDAIIRDNSRKAETIVDQSSGGITEAFIESTAREPEQKQIPKKDQTPLPSHVETRKKDPVVSVENSKKEDNYAEFEQYEEESGSDSNIDMELPFR